MAITLCDSCKTTSASLFCKADSAFLCITCDGKIHAANKLASCHARVWMCDVCEQAPASVTCKADAAALCVTCDREIHSANPLARRHERFPVVPFYDPATATPKISDGTGIDNFDQHYLLDFDVNVAGTEAEEAEVASWLIPDLNPKLIKSADEPEHDDLKSESKYLFNEIDSYPHNSPTDGVVPVQNKGTNYSNFQMPLHLHASEYASEDVVEGLPAYDVDYAGSKPFMYNFTSQSISQSVSSSSLEVGVVPDHNAGMVDVSNNQQQLQQHQSSMEVYPTPLVGSDREARVLRYKEKRKNRKFEKTIRYASRKAYAETRPRIKGRFAKRTEIDVEADDSLISPESSYGVVPTY
ncbi:zinc finger protein CONSTANS-LIKE 3-like [Rutidosis leptorrhynchoides]|uniref:zinc finger protein CONSTANS-LIKE 3-like n=1 Tax=Rutidosis leptorrhynchoides TaxID=125765 RepID=UPI003A9A10E3